MAIFEEHFRTFLLGQSVVTDLFDVRVYPLKVPQDELRVTLTYQLQKLDADMVLVGQTGRENRMYNLTVWDRSYLTAKTNAEVIQVLLNQRTHEMGPFRVICFSKDQRDVFDHEAQLFGVETDINLIFMNYPATV